jgi:hypothetical protein
VRFGEPISSDCLHFLRGFQEVFECPSWDGQLFQLETDHQYNIRY